jgi:hypothetical protein
LILGIIREGDGSAIEIMQTLGIDLAILRQKN